MRDDTQTRMTLLRSKGCILANEDDLAAKQGLHPRKRG